MRRTKILATVGPASSDTATLAALVRAGANALRVNFSHGTDEEHRETMRRIDALRETESRPLALVADLQGPKIRLGELQPSPLRLDDGDSWRLDSSGRRGGRAGASVSLPELGDAARPGDPILLGDGAVELVTESLDAGAVLTRVVHGGIVSSHAGVFLPRAHLRSSILGPKDRHDLGVAIAGGADFLALSFVRDARDVETARRELGRHGRHGEVGLIAKIERAEALGKISEILRAADAIMVARGDLGIEVPLERLAIEQKMLVRRANEAARPVIVATQMLLSMVNAPRPTRAEATDVANAVLDGADAVMLSEESAVGKYPVESVRWLDRIATATEEEMARHPRAREEASADPGIETGVAAAAVRLSQDLRAAAIVTPTHSGRTARLVSSFRPWAPIWAMSSRAPTVRQLALSWGVESIPCPKHLSLDALRQTAVEQIGPRVADREGRPLVLTAGYPLEGRPTNLVTVLPRPAEARRPALSTRRGSERRAKRTGRSRG